MSASAAWLLPGAGCRSVWTARQGPHKQHKQHKTTQQFKAKSTHLSPPRSALGLGPARFNLSRARGGGGGGGGGGLAQALGTHLDDASKVFTGMFGCCFFSSSFFWGGGRGWGWRRCFGIPPAGSTFFRLFFLLMYSWIFVTVGMKCNTKGL